MSASFTAAGFGGPITGKPCPKMRVCSPRCSSSKICLDRSNHRHSVICFSGRLDCPGPIAFIDAQKRPASLQAFLISGAGDRNRTCDLRVTSALLYRLSYTGVLRNVPLPCRLRKPLFHLTFIAPCSHWVRGLPLPWSRRSSLPGYVPGSRSCPAHWPVHRPGCRRCWRCRRRPCRWR